MMNYGYQQTIQYGGYMNVRSKDEAFNYPVAPGTMMIFAQNDGESIFTKIMGFSQYDKPFFNEYVRVKEEPSNSPNLGAKNAQPNNSATPSLESEFEAIRGQIEGILNDIRTMKKDLYEEGGEG